MLEPTEIVGVLMGCWRRGGWRLLPGGTEQTQMVVLSHQDRRPVDCEGLGDDGDSGKRVLGLDMEEEGQ